MKRVLHIASGREWRGGQHQVLLLASGLHVAGIPTAVITGRDTALATHLAAARVPVIATAWTWGIDPRAAWRMLASIADGDIVHAHDSHAHAIAEAVVRVRVAPVVVTRRVMFPVTSVARYRRARAVIAVSQAVRRELERAGVPAEKLHVVPDAIAPGADAVSLASTDTPLIVCVAALTSEKGIDILLDAAALLRQQHPQARWLVAGDGPLGEALVEHRRRLALDEVVELRTAPMSAAQAVAGATIVVQPSRSEGLGSAVLQALAMGVPVIASDTGGLPDALAHGGGLLVAPESPLELAAGVGRLLEDAELRRRLGAEGRSAALEFSVARLVQRTLDVYRSIDTSPDAR